jgi:hypothetical protein
VVGHIEAPFTAKPQKTHDKPRRMMRPRRPRDLDAPARRTRDLGEDDIGRSTTPRPRVERARLPLLAVPNIDFSTGPEIAGRAHDRFATLFGQFALATSTATITAFLVFWTFTTEWTHGPSSRSADGDLSVTAAVPTTGVAAPIRVDTTAPRETANSQPTSAPFRRLDRAEIAYLLKRGEELVAAGELGPARLVLRRAAEAGHPNAAFVLATTYDPVLLEARRVIGIAPDIAMARAWYEKAKEFGSIDASRRLELLTRAVKIE